MINKITQYKDLIINALVLISFLFIIYKILSTTLFTAIKKKLNPYQIPDEEKDFDKIVKRKVDMLRSTGGIYTSGDQIKNISKATSASVPNTITHSPAHLKTFYDDLNWGAGGEVKKIIKIFQRELNFNVNEAGLRATLKKIIKEDSFLKLQSGLSSDEVIHLLYARLLLGYLIGEVQQQKPHFIKKIAARLSVSPDIYMYALQISLIKTSSQTSTDIYCTSIILNKLPDDKIQNLIDLFVFKFCQDLIKTNNGIHEIIRTNFMLADLVRPWKEITKESNIDEALLILGCHRESSAEEIKNAYKKLSIEKHPDKITSQKLPREIEKNALKQFQIVKNAYDYALKNRKDA